MQLIKKSTLVKTYNFFIYLIMILSRSLCFNKKDIRLSLAKAVPFPSLATGGRVKLAHLLAEYGDHCYQHNLVYAVSSAVSGKTKVFIDNSIATGSKLVWNQNGVAYPAWSDAPGSINDPMSNMLHRASYVIYQSNFCKLAADKFLGPVSVSSSVIYNSVDTDIFTPCTDKLVTEEKVLLVAGTSYTKEKILLPLQVLAAMLADGYNLRLKIAGRLAWPKAQAEIRAIIAKLALTGKVDLIGPYSQSQAPSIYQQGDILLHLKYADACPTTIIEAMACGLPIIALDSGGMPELVADAGVLIKTDFSWDKVFYPSETDIITAIKATLLNYENLRELAVKRAKGNFSRTIWLAKHREIFNQLLHV